MMIHTLKTVIMIKVKIKTKKIAIYSFVLH